MPSSLLQVVNSLFQTCYNNWEQTVRRQLVESLGTDLQQLVRFYVCTWRTLRAIWWVTLPDGLLVGG